MTANQPIFGLRLENVPIVNLRNEFRRNLQLFLDDSFRAGLAEQRDAVYTDLFAYTTRGALLTHILQRSVMGLEAYLPWAVLHEATLRRVLTHELFAKARNPFKLGGKGTVANYYDRLPAQVDPACSLRVCDPDLYQQTIGFYREVRNPLFHGCEVHGDLHGDATLETLRFIDRLFQWIDSWCPRADMFKSTRESASVANEPVAPSRGDRVTLKLRIPTLPKT